MWIFQDGMDLAVRCFVSKLFSQVNSASGTALLFDVLETLVEKNLVSVR